MQYRWNPEAMAEVFALPAGVVDEHIRLAGSVQLKVLLWLARAGKGEFDPQKCAAAIGQSAADCTDALQYWVETGLLGEGAPGERRPAEKAVPAEPTKKETSTKSPAKAPAPAVARPAAVKPQMKEVIARQKESPEFAYLLDNSSARLGKALSPNEMGTLLYLHDGAGLPAEVILMVIAYAVAEGKPSIRYIEKMALNWADQGIDTIAAAEAYFCTLERRREAWAKVREWLGLDTSGTIAQQETAEKWVFLWQISEALIRLAGEQCQEKIGKCNVSYVDKILESWRADGIDTPEKVRGAEKLEKTSGRKKKAAAKDTSLDMEAYMEMTKTYIPKF